jgi:hypothetical protein
MEFTQILLSSGDERLQTLIGVFSTFLIILFMYLTTWIYAKHASLKKQLKDEASKTVATAKATKLTTQESARMVQELVDKCEIRYKILAAKYNLQIKVGATRMRQIKSLEKQLATQKADQQREILTLQEKVEVLEAMIVSISSTVLETAKVAKGEIDEA